MISNQMPTLSLAVLLLHCALARDSQVLRRLANTMGDNNDANVTTHRRLEVKAEDRAFHVEHDANVELKCLIPGYKSPAGLLGKYTLTLDSHLGKSHSKTFTNEKTDATIRLCEENENHLYNEDWVISDSLGLMHFWAPISTNNPGFPPKTGWYHVAFDDDASDFVGEKPTCTYLKCDKIWKKHDTCIASTRALTQVPNEVTEQNERVQNSLVLEGDISERDESSSGELHFFECDQCDGLGNVSADSDDWWGTQMWGSKKCDNCDGDGGGYW